MSSARRPCSTRVSRVGASWMFSGHAGIHGDTIAWTSDIGLHISLVYPYLSWQQSLTGAASSRVCATLGPMRNVLLPPPLNMQTHTPWGSSEAAWDPSAWTWGSADHLAVLEYFLFHFCFSDWRVVWKGGCCFLCVILGMGCGHFSTPWWVRRGAEVLYWLPPSDDKRKKRIWVVSATFTAKNMARNGNKGRK